MLLLAAALSAQVTLLGSYGPLHQAAGSGWLATPGGFFCELQGRTMRLAGEDRRVMASFELQHGEELVLAVADSGARVTETIAGHYRPGRSLEEEDRGERMVTLQFRGPGGQLLAERELAAVAGSRPAAFGDEAFVLVREARELAVRRISAAEAGTRVLSIPLEEVRRSVGRLEEASLHASAAGLVLELRGGGRTLFAAAGRRSLLYPPAFQVCGAEPVLEAFPRGAGFTLATPGALLSFDADGREVSRSGAPLGAAIVPRADEGVLLVTENELVLLGRDDAEVWRATLAAGEEGDISAAVTGEREAVPLPEPAPEAAELVIAEDAARLRRIDRREEESSDDGRFHVPAARHAPALLACLPGAGPALLEGVVTALMSPVFADDTPETLHGLAALLAGAARSEDASVRAAVQLLAPYYELPLDVEVWRRDVLSRPETLPLAMAALWKERLLHRDAWTAVFAETVARARRQTKAPEECPLLSRNADSLAPALEDAYCAQVVPLLFRAADPESSRLEEARRWLRSPAAPPELRLETLAQEVAEGTAGEAGRLELWHAAELPWSVRRTALAGPQGVDGETWRRELAGAHGPAEEAALLSAWRERDPQGAAALAAGRLEGEAWPERAEHRSVWLESLGPEPLAQRPALRARLLRELDGEAGDEVALLLARTGEPAALPRLRALAADVSDEGAGSAALEALYRLDAPAAEQTAREALERALAAGCVPGRLVRLLAEHGATPFAQVAAKLEEAACRREALRPRTPIDLPGEAGSLAAAFSESLSRAECRAAFVALFGLDRHRPDTRVFEVSIQVR